MSGGVKEVSAEYKSARQADVCPKGYKRTEVGIVPEDWEAKHLGALALIQRGASPRPIDSPIWFDQSSQTGWLRISDVTKAKKYLLETTQNLSELGIKNSRPVAAGNLVMSICATVGRPIITRKDVCIHDGFVVFNSPSVDIEYLYYVLSDIENDWGKHGQTGSQMNLNTGLINSTYIPIPATKEEQTAIANALSDVDTLITSLETLITKKRAIKTAAMQQLLTGKKRLPPYDKTHTGYKQTELGEIPEDWEIRELGNIGAFTKGAGVKKDESNSGNIPCIRYGEIYTKHSDYIKTYSSYISESVAQTATKLLKGDLLFAGSGETKEEIGKCVAFVDDLDAYAGGDIVILRPQWGDSLFMGYCLNSDYVVKQKSSKGQGDAVVHISANALRSVQVLLPCSQAEQQSIADVLLDMDKDLDELEKRLTKTQQLKQGMMQELLTGKTRLI